MTDRVVLAPDVLRYGEFFVTPTIDLSIAAQIAHVHRMIAKRSTGPVHLLGHAMSGAIVSLFAAQHSALVPTIAGDRRDPADLSLVDSLAARCGEPPDLS
jgi:pimeloyl-ACP methyl ester carboxylesterase